MGEEIQLDGVKLSRALMPQLKEMNMQEIHYALDSQGNYQVAPGDIELAQEHRLPENFPSSQVDEVTAACTENNLHFVALPVNLHKDVMP